MRPTWTARVLVLILAMATVTDSVANQVWTDTDVRVALKASSTAEGLGVLESCDDEGEPIVGGAPAVRVVAEGHVVGPGDDEPVAAHRAGLGVTGDVGLAIQTVGMKRGGLLTLQAPAT